MPGGKRSGLQWARSVFLTTLAGVCVFAVGCNDTGPGTRLAKAGAESASAVGDFYDQLSSMEEQNFQLKYVLDPPEVPISDLLNDRLSPDERAKLIEAPSTNERLRNLARLKSIEQELQLRSSVFHRLAETYSALGGLAGDDVSGDVQTSTKNLLDAANGIVPIGAGVKAVAGFVADLLGSFEAARRNRDVRAVARLLKEVAHRLDTAFQDEATTKRIYFTIVSQNVGNRQRVARKLDNKGLIDKSPIYNGYIHPLGLSLNPQVMPTGPRDPFAGRREFLDLLGVKAREDYLATEGKAARAVKSILRAHEDFEADRDDSVMAALVAAKGLVDSLAKLRATLEK